ncbi:MAG: DUF434 domain-containing protein [Candidatus Omnitrophota bacterium]
MKEIINDTFKAAVNDYFFLKNKNYAARPALKLVGDHYRLTGQQRTMLYRGITSSQTATLRQRKLITDPEELKGKTLFLDGCNILFTLINYLTGKTIFLGNDGILRDTGSESEPIGEPFIDKAVERLIRFLETSGGSSVIIVLDRSLVNVSRYENALIKEYNRLKKENPLVLPITIQSVPSADNRLKQCDQTDHEYKDVRVIGTADSEIIDAVAGRIIDAARYILENEFNVKISDLKNLLKDKGDA